MTNENGSAMISGKLYQNVEFVDCLADAEMEVLYDKIEYDYKNNVLLYLRHGYLVATTPMQGAI